MKPYSQIMIEDVSRAVESFDLHSADLVSGFISSQIHTDGGFVNRAGEPDIYYTAFGLALILAFKNRIKINSKTEKYINSFKCLDDLDFIHLVSLLRARQTLKLLKLPSFMQKWIMKGSRIQLFNKLVETEALDKEIVSKCDQWRSSDGGFNQNSKGAENCTSYASFLACSMFQDLNMPVKIKTSSIAGLKTSDGGYSNEAERDVISAPATAAGIVTKIYLENKVDNKAVNALLALNDKNGGFRAIPEAPFPDLLSTAVSLHALKMTEHDMINLQLCSLGFIESNWMDDGGFSSNSILDTKSDIEYTFYALLALGSIL